MTSRMPPTLFHLGLRLGRTAARPGVGTASAWARARTWARAAACGLALATGLPAPAAAAAQDSVASPAMVEVVGFDVTGNTLLAPARIAQALEPFKGRRSLGELAAAAQVLQRLYAVEGYGGVVAYLPPQQRNDGVVQLVVVEGRLAPIVIRGGAIHLGADNVRASVPELVPGTTPRLPRLDAQLQIANENPAKNLRVLLKPGQRSGEVDAEVTVQETPPQRLILGADDTGNPRTGEYRASVAWQHANLTGHDDVLTAQYQTSPSHTRQVRVLSGGYRYPLYAQRTVLDVFMATSDVDGGSLTTAAGDLRFSGKGRIAGARATAYLARLGEVDQRASLGLDQRIYLNQCAIAGLPAGACGSAGESVAVQPLSLDYSLQSGGDTAWGASLGLTRNLALGGRYASPGHFEAVRAGARPRYTTLRFSGSWSLPVAEVASLRARLTAQHTADALVPGEQFGLGGALSVRGYEERELTGDSGVLLGLELWSPELLALAPAGSPLLQLFGFAEAGQVRNRPGTPCLGASRRCALGSWGAGVRFEWAGLQVRLAVARALRDAVSTQRDDTRAHVAVSYTF